MLTSMGAALLAIGLLLLVPSAARSFVGRGGQSDKGYMVAGAVLAIIGGVLLGVGG